ncbi:hypothetical protein BGW38_002362 [Lunasporangiospora selenospora]|uniref:Ubiquitinyl hydrolase 1 n=1 Tax=Lunasporangiospora selenospora TaxID=979761 RepID=A0A9P6G1C9_9FUNG|nr:hypothetical protein BGW38_002362 [Lunasporangiospora selenospora]
MAKNLFTAKVFLEDIVYRKDKPEIYGLVVKTWHDFESGDSDSEDEDSSGPLKLQYVLIHWVDGSAPETIHEDELVVIDRSFGHGDVVKLSPNDVMSGTVIDVKVDLDLERVCPPNTQYSGIDAQHVDFVQQFVVNNHVIYDGWLGVIENVSDEVTVILNDNCVCVVKESHLLDLRDKIHDQSCFFPDSLSPGYAVYAPSRVFKSAKYLAGSYKPSHRQGYVLRVEVTSITVNWLSFNPLALDQTPGVTPPPRKLDDFENITVYKSSEQHCTYELHDRVKIANPEILKALGVQEYCPYLRSKPTRLLCPNTAHNHTSKFVSEEMKVTKTSTRVTVQWQDLSISENVCSTTLVPYLNVDDQDVWPADYVLLKTGEVLKDQPGGISFDRKKSDLLGIVQSVDAKERTTQVKWFSEERDQGLEQELEELSLYEITSHPDLEFTMGDLVIISRGREQSPTSDIAPRAPSVDEVLTLVGRGNEIYNEITQKAKTEPWELLRQPGVLLESYGVEGLEALDRYLSETNKMARKTIHHLVDRGNPLKPVIPDEVLATLPQHDRDLETIRTRLHWIGQIWKVYQDRPTVLVQFMDGTSEEIPVGRIMVVEDEDDDSDSDDDGGEVYEEYEFEKDEAAEASSENSWETDSGADEDSMSDIDSDTAAVKKPESDDRSYVKPTEEPPMASAGSNTANKVVEELLESDSVEADPLPDPEPVVLHNGRGLAKMGEALSEGRENWKGFVVVEETPADHYFRNHDHSETSDKAWVKRVAKEHSILSTSLPEGIRVRAFEDRMDLLRVLIQGPDHTPYKNALFLFDFKLPSQYPAQPPAAFFHSWTGGVGRINPNLYEDGNVCLSLLNTWHGKDQTETWTPSSSILQLLISLQGLVLVREPYYNEAGFEKFVGTEEAARNSELYNEKVYLLSLKTVQTILNHPPTPFESEVRHFYFEQEKLEQIVIEGLELIARSEATEDNVASAKGPKASTDRAVDNDAESDTQEAEGTASTVAGSESEPSAVAEDDYVIQRISKGALKVLKKHIDTLSFSLEEPDPGNTTFATVAQGTYWIKISRFPNFSMQSLAKSYDPKQGPAFGQLSREDISKVVKKDDVEVRKKRRDGAAKASLQSQSSASSAPLTLTTEESTLATPQPSTQESHLDQDTKLSQEGTGAEVYAETGAGDEPTISSDSSEPAQAPVPPVKLKGWAELLRPKGAPSAPNSQSTPSPNTKSAEQSKTGSRNGIKLDGIADILHNYKPTFTSALIQPRGLVNNGNMCFMNAILQPLIHCPPLYNLLSQISNHVVHSFKSTTPLVDSLVMFLNEFQVARVNQPDYGSSLVPEYVYDALRGLKRFDSMRGRQEDCQEFLGYLLDGLHEEFLKAMKEKPNGTDAHDPVDYEDSESGVSEDEWMEVTGPKNKASYTRSTQFSETPISMIFSGQLRSILRIPSQKDSVTLEPFQSLQLDLTPDNVHTIEDALHNTTIPEVLDGFTSSEKGGATVEATKKIFIEHVPPVLVVHLKRFIYKDGGTQKLHKQVGYNTTLNLQPELVSPSRRPSGPIPYKLFGVVYHHGRTAAGGHYTCDVLRQNLEWLHIDDTNITVISEADVTVDTREQAESFSSPKPQAATVTATATVAGTSMAASLNGTVANGVMSESAAFAAALSASSIPASKSSDGVAYVLFYVRADQKGPAAAFSTPSSPSPSIATTTTSTGANSTKSGMVNGHNQYKAAQSSHQSTAGWSPATRK